MREEIRTLIEVGVILPLLKLPREVLEIINEWIRWSSYQTYQTLLLERRAQRIYYKSLYYFSVYRAFYLPGGVHIYGGRDFIPGVTVEE